MGVIVIPLVFSFFTRIIYNEFGQTATSRETVLCHSGERSNVQTDHIVRLYIVKGEPEGDSPLPVCLRTGRPLGIVGL